MSPITTAVLFGIAGVCIVIILRHIVVQLQHLDDKLSEMFDPEEPEL